MLMSDELTIDPGWRLLAVTGHDESLDLGDGTYLFRVEWTDTGRRITVVHRSVRHTLRIYAVAGSQPPLLFAITEVSNGVWMIAVPA